MKNGYVTNAAQDSKINDLKAQHIADGHLFGSFLFEINFKVMLQTV